MKVNKVTYRRNYNAIFSFHRVIFLHIYNIYIQMVNCKKAKIWELNANCVF